MVRAATITTDRAVRTERMSNSGQIWTRTPRSIAHNETGWSRGRHGGGGVGFQYGGGGAESAQGRKDPTPPRLLPAPVLPRGYHSNLAPAL
ncbi:hypothetical protein J4Q44_G00292540 [Coregonus suidteri]|uniref:Uncharacterized protein n=1 Tax=Coregonus suidteri TaxID=861788 RepID=A0AAN8LI16_9TELE